jgi:hypothetical protein
MFRAMSTFKSLAPLPLLLLTLSCGSEDPRLPQSLYEKALELNKSPDKKQEAKSLMELVAKRYPETPAGTQAQKDLYVLDMLLRQEIQERQKQVRVTMKRTMDALTRYRQQKGEYPGSLAKLAPDYLEKTPETPWGHPFFYRPYVLNPIESVRGRRGVETQRFNTAYDGYYLVCLGVDLQPGGSDMAADISVANGEFLPEKSPFPPIPAPQPVK